MSDRLIGEKVVSLGPARTRNLFPALGRIEAYWEGLRNGRAMPARADVDPRGIAGVLEHAFILERVAPGVARIRLAGMTLNEVMAMEVRGMPLSAMFLPEARRELQRITEELLTAPAVVRLTLGADTGYTRPSLEAQMMLLPLRDAFGAPTRILGVMETRGKIGRGPRRFMIRDVETKAIATDPATRPHPAVVEAEHLPEPRPTLVTVDTDAPHRTHGERDCEPAGELDGGWGNGRDSGQGNRRGSGRDSGRDSGSDAARPEGFASRTRALAARIAARNATPQAEEGDGKAAATPAAGHLRLVHDADTLA